MNYIEKLDNNKIGFTFITDYLITRRTFENVSLKIFAPEFIKINFLIIDHL
jgi:hypothetical protein